MPQGRGPPPRPNAGLRKPPVIDLGAIEAAFRRDGSSEVLQQINIHVKADDEGFIFIAQDLGKKFPPTSFSISSTRCWLPLASIRMPRVSGRLDSAVKYLMVCGLPSSAISKSSFSSLGSVHLFCPSH